MGSNPAVRAGRRRCRSFWMGCAPCIVLERRRLCRRHARATQLGVSPEQAERHDSPRGNAICRMVDASEVAFVTRVRPHPEVFPARCQPTGRAGAGSAAPRTAHLRVPPAIQHALGMRQTPRAAQAVRMRDVSATTPAEPRQPAWIGPAQAPNGALSSAANDAHTGRSRPQSQGGSQPPSQQWSGVRRSSQSGHRGGAPL